MSGKIKHLVVDTSAFIKGAPLQDISEKAYTVPEVVDEVTSKRQLRKLIVLPYDLIVKDVFPENVKFVSDFAKKTGDYTSLSSTDIKVLALTYQMEKEKVGVNHLKTEPTMQRTIKVTGIKNTNNESTQENNVTQQLIIGKDVTEQKEPSLKVASDLDAENPSNTTESTSTDQINDPIAGDNDEGEDELSEDLAENLINLELKEEDDILVKAEEDNSDTGSEETGSESDDSSDGEWITAGNIKEKKKEMDQGDFIEVENVEVACITTDFAMQNVLKQIGLNVTSIDGRLIRQVRTFIFRCTTCFKTTSVMTKLFCPKCGHATLKKVAVSVDEHGNQQIHINGRKPLTARGKRFSLPTPKGGQHFQYPIQTEDQHIHKRNATRLARAKNNPLDPDYIAGFSPFIMRDVNSKSAVLGVRHDKQDVKFWMSKKSVTANKRK